MVVVVEGGALGLAGDSSPEYLPTAELALQDGVVVLGLDQTRQMVSEVRLVV